MKLFIICFLALSAVSARVVEIKRQDCATHCWQNTNAGCTLGQVCVYNGCGHSCLPFLIAKRAMCLGVMCNSYCPNGHQMSADGCLTCACKPDHNA